MSTNEFAKVTQLVDAVLNRYRTVRKVCGIADDAWHSRRIERIAKPFIKGYFTLAVVGKVSAGKSTFINALLGCKDLLPTGHDQTTCGVTYIEYGETPEVTIIFGDGHKTTIKDNIRGQIKTHVAIPEKFHNLPVNHIDDLIMENKDFEKIWELHDQIEKETLCARIDKALLKEYVNHRKKKDIAIEVRIKFPFNEELKGWRVIDTPGIGAIGGIETRTKKLLASQNEDGSREVDAIIFLQNGSQTLDQTDTKQFIKEQLDNLTESDKRRLFYVLTHSSSTDFLNHMDSKLNFIKQNYGDKIKCLTYADSLLYTFLNYLAGSQVDLKAYDDFEKPDEWADDEWDAIMTILFNAKQRLKKNGDAFNNDTMLRTIQAWAHFDSLKSEINQFAKEEKQKSLRELISLIAADYLGFVTGLEREKELVDGDLAKINEAISEVDKKRTEINSLAKLADKNIRIDEIKKQFLFFDEHLSKIDSCVSINTVKTAITNLFDLVQAREKSVFDDIQKEFACFFKQHISDHIIIDSIDFASIEDNATQDSQEIYVIEPARTITHCCEADEYIKAKYGYRTNETEKLSKFKILVKNKGVALRDKFLRQVTNKANQFREQVFSEIDKKLKEEKVRLEELKGKLACKQEFKAENDRLIAESHAASKELIRLVEEYGIKYKK